MFSLDIFAMYLSIPTARAPGWVEERCRNFSLNEGLIKWLGKIIRRMLKGNKFEYDELYSQESGTAIGVLFACAYTGVAMGKIEEEGLKHWGERQGGGGGIIKGHSWERGDLGEVDWCGRYRDDCIGLWRGTRLEFYRFVAVMNELDEDIKFTYSIDFEENKVAFLDTLVQIDDKGYIQMILYVKKNVKNALLLPSSCHRPMVTRATVLGLAL